MRVGRVIAAVAAVNWAVSAWGQVYRFEAENGVLNGTVVRSNVAGYSGTGFVTDFNSSTDQVTVSATGVPAGLYELWVKYRSPYGKKGYTVTVGGETGSGMFDTSNSFALDRAGLFQVSAGANPMSILQNWGYYDIDYMELRPSAPKVVAPIAPTLVDPLATPNTHVLMDYMTSIYGIKTLAGQQGAITSAYVRKSGGLLPAVSGADFIDYSPSRLQYGANPNGETERMVDWATSNGGIATMMWHWNAPSGLINTNGKEWWRGFYTDATTFDVADALAHPGGANYNLLVRDIDAIAVELKKFQAAGVPVLWRPLHEAQGGWFWWGAKGPGAFKSLWHLMYDRLTNYNGLHNLIWVYTSSTAVEGYQQWFPNPNEVDIVGADVYTDQTSSMSGEWMDLLDPYNGQKMVTLSETGTLPNADLMRQRGIHWSWFNPWSLNDVLNNYSSADLRALLGDVDVITLDELPALPWNYQDFLPGDANGNGVIDADDYALFDRGMAKGLSGWGNGDFNGDGYVDGQDYSLLLKGAAMREAMGISIPEPTSMAGIGLVMMMVARRSQRKHGAHA